MIANGQFYWYSNQLIPTRCKIMDCTDDQKNAQNKPLVYEIDTGRRQRVKILFLNVIIMSYLFSSFEILFNFLIKKKGPIDVNEYFLFKCSIDRFKRLTQAEVQRLTTEFKSNSVFLADSIAMTPTPSRSKSRFTKSSRQILTLYD
jgi:hypothetical protein